MAKDLTQDEALRRSDKTRFIEVASGVYARLDAAVVLSGDSVIAADNPLPVTVSYVTPGAAALTLFHGVAFINGDTEVTNANEARKYLLLVNDSASVIYLRLEDGAAAVHQGIRLNANGGSYEMTAATGVYQGAVRAIHGDGLVDRALLVTEGV
jgi:hypothetical protein